MKTNNIDWEKRKKFFGEQKIRIEKELKLFLKKHKEWNSNLYLAVNGLGPHGIFLDFWLKPEARPKRKTEIVYIAEKGCFIKEEEMELLAEFVGTLIADVNLEAKYLSSDNNYRAEYRITVKDYDPFLK